MALWALAGLLASGAATHAAGRSARPFHFRMTPFMIAWRADAAAEAFVADHIRPGMPLQAAVQAATAADASCRLPAPGSGAPTICTYDYFVSPPDGDLGEAEWRITIVPRPDGTVASAALTHERRGL